MKKLTLSLFAILSVLMLMAIGCDREITGEVKEVEFSSAGCFTCHGSNDLSLAAARLQYENSVHGIGENSDRNRLASPGYATCEQCHTHQGFVAKVDGLTNPNLDFSAITCFTCHSPHTNGTLEVRVTEAVQLANGFTFDRGKANVCVTCHQSRRDVGTTVVAGVTLSGHWGPHHSNQGDMLIGENSYEYGSYVYTKSWHATGVNDGCVACHMSPSMHESIGGHSWNMRNVDRGFENTTGCNVTGCHDTSPIDDLDRPAAADFDWDGTIEGTQTEITGLLDSLQILLESAGLVDSTGTPVGGRTVSTADSAGAVYNFLFVEEDRSLGVHNTDYAVGLLQSSINFLATGDPNGAPAINFSLLNSH